MKIKVLHILNRLIIGGPTIIALNIIENLPDDFEVKLLAGEKDEGEEDGNYIFDSMPSNIVLVPQMRRSINLINDISAYRAIRRIIKTYKPDIVHTHASKAGALGRIAAVHSKVPIVIHTFHGHVFHSYFNRLSTWLFLITERYLAKKSTKILAISKSQKEELTNDFNICNPDKIKVIPNGIALDKFIENNNQKRKEFRNSIGIDDDDMIIIGIVGRMVPVKNHTMFIKVAHSILSRNQSVNVKFIIVGDGETRNEIQHQLDELKIKFCYLPENQMCQDSKVILTSWQTHMDCVFSGLDIVCLTSLNEGTPISLIEAQAAGCPVVSTNVGGVRDTVIQSQTALLSKVNDIEAFCDNLEQLIKDKSLRARMGKNGREYVMETYNQQRFIKEISECYKELYLQKN